MAKRASILLNFLNLSPNKIQAIISGFNDIDSIWQAKYSDLRQISLLTDTDIKKILDLRNSRVFDKELKLIEKEKIDCLDLFDQDYPPLLKEISNPPLVLYIKGDRSILNKFLFAIVNEWKFGKILHITNQDFDNKLHLLHQNPNIIMYKHEITDSFLSPIMEIIIIQLFVYKMAEDKGIEPGKFNYSQKITDIFK